MSSKKVLVTGAKGMLGTDICRILGEKTEVIGIDIEEMDICDTLAVYEKIPEYSPDIVIHCAAYANVDGAETNPDQALKVNGLGTWNIASVCAKLDIPIVYISTDFVFDGKKKEPYFEFDSVNPLGMYGISKLAGERAIQWVTKKYYIVRTAWLFGEHGKSFPRTIIEAAKIRPELKVVSDSEGSPTYTVDLSMAVSNIIKSPLYGIYHVTNKGSCTWFNFAKKALEFAGIDTPVRPISSSEWKSPTKRPEYSVLRHYTLEVRGMDNIRPWEEALQEFVENISK